MSPATDTAGNTQVHYAENESLRGPATFYHNSAIRPWKIARDGRVTFAMKEMV